MGISGFAFAPLSRISPDHAALTHAVKRRLAAKLLALPPGLRAQYEVMLARLDDAAPCCEFMCFPGTSMPAPPDPSKKVRASRPCWARAWDVDCAGSTSVSALRSTTRGAAVPS
jgi:hypothetical protein